MSSVLPEASVGSSDAIVQKKARNPASKGQLAMLRAAYKANPNPSPEEFEAIAEGTGRSKSQVKGYFRNQRQQSRKSNGGEQIGSSSGPVRRSKKSSASQPVAIWRTDANYIHPEEPLLFGDILFGLVNLHALYMREPAVSEPRALIWAVALGFNQEGVRPDVILTWIRWRRLLDQEESGGIDIDPSKLAALYPHAASSSVSTTPRSGAVITPISEPSPPNLSGGRAHLPTPTPSSRGSTPTLPRSFHFGDNIGTPDLMTRVLDRGNLIYPPHDSVLFTGSNLEPLSPESRKDSFSPPTIPSSVPGFSSGPGEQHSSLLKDIHVPSDSLSNPSILTFHGSSNKRRASAQLHQAQPSSPLKIRIPARRRTFPFVTAHSSSALMKSPLARSALEAHPTPMTGFVTMEVYTPSLNPSSPADFDEAEEDYDDEDDDEVTEDGESEDEAVMDSLSSDGSSPQAPWQSATLSFCDFMKTRFPTRDTFLTSIPKNKIQYEATTWSSSSFQVAHK